jgi:hypothetical protein
MKKLLSRVGVIAAIIACMAMVARTSAYAEGGGIWALEGSGTISPGLTSTPSPQSGTFVATVAVGADVVVGAGVGTSVAAASGTCGFSFVSTLAGGETTALGAGSATGGCSASFAGTSQSLTACTFLYLRVGPLVVLEAGTAVGAPCTVSGTGPAGSGSAVAILGAGVFVLVPTAAAPITSFVLSGAAVAGD